MNGCSPGRLPGGCFSVESYPPFSVSVLCSQSVACLSLQRSHRVADDRGIPRSRRHPRSCASELPGGVAVSVMTILQLGFPFVLIPVFGGAIGDLLDQRGSSRALNCIHETVWKNAAEERTYPRPDVRIRRRAKIGPTGFMGGYGPAEWIHSKSDAPSDPTASSRDCGADLR